MIKTISWVKRLQGEEYFSYFAGELKKERMKHYRLLLISCLLLLLASSCREPNRHVKIVCTSDVHGNLFSYDYLSEDSVRGGLARVSAYLREQRRQGNDIVYVDNGDMLQGTLATYCYNTHAVSYPHIAAEVLNYLQCDAVVLGDNDIGLGGPTYQRYRNDLSCEVLAGNILFTGGQSPFSHPYTIIERGGLRIAVMGLTTSAIPHWTPRSQWSGLTFDDMEHAAQRWMHHLKANAAPDIVIGVFHAGYEGGVVTEEYVENATRRVAEQVPGFDAVFYGHDHQPRLTEVVNVEGDTVWLLNPGRDACQVATLDVTLTPEGKIALVPSLVEMDDYARDSLFLAEFASHRERIDQYVDSTIVTSTSEAPMSECLYGPSAVMDLIHQIQLDVTGAQVSFAAPLAMDAGIPEGAVTVRDLYRLLPYENNLYVLWLTGSEIKDYLEMSYEKWITQLETPDAYRNFDSAAGIVYEVNPMRERGERVYIKNMADGEPFNKDARYMVSVNSYRAHGGGGLMTEGARVAHEELQRRIIYNTTADIRFHVISSLGMRKTITPQPLGNWKFCPAL